MASRDVAIAEKEQLAAAKDNWRHDNVGRYLNNAVSRFEQRVFAILATEAQISVRQSLLSLTRNLDRHGTRANELARRAGMTRQAMAEMVAQAEAIGIVSRTSDPADARAKVVQFTSAGLTWLEALRSALDRAAAEMAAEVGTENFIGLIATLRLYSASYHPLGRD